MGVFSTLQSNRKFYHIYTVTIVIDKSCDLSGTLGIAKFVPKQGQVFQINIMSLCWLKRYHLVKEHRETSLISIHSYIYPCPCSSRPYPENKKVHGYCCDTPLVCPILILKFSLFQAPVKKPEEKDPIFEEDEMERVSSNLLCL